MAEYIEREALSKWLHETMSAQTTTVGMAYVREFWNKVLDAPAADVAPVVRCKDCKHYKPNAMVENSCFNSNWNDEYAIPTSPDDFCSYGERKGGDGK